MYLYDLFQEYPQITTDSRNCIPGSIFFALKGENFNANAFAAGALEKGCQYAVVDEPQYAINEKYILVDDVLKTLQDLATFHRKTLGTKIIGITGSNGKTTSKELIAAVLKEKYKIHFTKGNLNNHIGVPLTLLQLKSEHQLAIVEMGANHPGEIKLLSEITQPDFGIITNVGKAHLEGFGSFEGVKKTKAELYDFIATDGLGIFINTDNEHLVGMASKSGIKEEKQIPFSLKNHPDISMVTGKITKNDPLLGMECQTGSTFQVNTNLIGAYNAENILAAVTIGHFFGLSNALIKKGIESYIPQNNRSQLTITERNKLIVDAYNANPTSMQAAILNFSSMEAENKLLILGDMLELGEESKSEHQKIILLLEENGFKDVFLVGKEFKQTIHAFKHFDQTEALNEYLTTRNFCNLHILIKGSRGISLEKTIPFL